MKKYSIWLLGFAALVAGACSTDRTGDETLALSASSVSANKRGMTYEGGDVTFDVLSNVYWVINLDEDGRLADRRAPCGVRQPDGEGHRGRESRGQAFDDASVRFAGRRDRTDRGDAGFLR